MVVPSTDVTGVNDCTSTDVTGVSDCSSTDVTGVIVWSDYLQ